MLVEAPFVERPRGAEALRCIRSVSWAVDDKVAVAVDLVVLLALAFLAFGSVVNQQLYLAAEILSL